MDLMDILSYEMHGIQQFPGLRYYYPNHSMEELNLNHYEILPNEPLDDVLNYLKNIYHEFPWHMTNNDKKIVIDQSINGKEGRNSSDYRKSLLLVCAFFHRKISWYSLHRNIRNTDSNTRTSLFFTVPHSCIYCYEKYILKIIWWY